MELGVPPSTSLSGFFVEDYFRLAAASPTKLEYKAGEIIDMAGASYDHTRIASNLIFSIKTRLGSRPCDALDSDMRVRAAGDRYCYPDVTVVCGDPIFDPLNSGSTLTNPQVLFEIVSPSTEATNRGEKFFRYIRIPSLREYFLVSQVSPRIESFARREDDSGSVGPVAEGIESPFTIQSLGVEIPLGEIYRNIQFNPEK